jgi:peroxiredoxin
MTINNSLKAGNTIDDINGNKFSLNIEKEKRKIVLIFLRSLGCPLCEISRSQFKNAYHEFFSRNTEVGVFLQSNASTIRESGDEKAFPFRLIPGHDEKIYQL